MTDETVENQVEQTQPTDREINFRKMEAMYERQLEGERQARLQAERQLAERSRQPEEEDDDDEPYVDKKKLAKKLERFGEKQTAQTQNQINQAVKQALQEERQTTWMKNNPDFYDVMKHANKLPQYDNELAETILAMPEGFERQKLVYKNLKALGLHQDKKAPSIQEKVDSNRRSPYYQPTGLSTAPYSTGGDFTKQGQKTAYDKMQDLKSKLRL